MSAGLGRGLLHGALGAPQSGKTWHVRDLIARLFAAEAADLAIVHDPKSRKPQYGGRLVVGVDRDNLATVIDDEPPVAICHPSANLATEITSPGAICSAAIELARHDVHALVVLDEAYHALSGPMNWQDPSCGRVFREGSSQGISMIWTTQIPQRLPTEALDLSETVALFRLARRSQAYAARAFQLDDDVAECLPRLAQGEFLLVTSDGCDATIYGPA